MSIPTNISAKPIYLLFTLKFFLWSIGMITFHQGLQLTAESALFINYSAGKYIILFLSLLGIVSFKINSRMFYFIIADLYFLLSLYIALGFGFSTNFIGSPFFRNVADTIFAFVMLVNIRHDNTMMNKKIFTF